MKRPNPKDYHYDTRPPTDMLNETFVITAIEETSYEGLPQLKLTVLVGDATDFINVYVSNGTVRNFLRDLSNTEFLHDPLEFYKENPEQRHYQIRYASTDEPQVSDKPF